MDWFAPVLNYCERTDPGSFGEPLNAFSNAAFFIAAWCLWRAYRRLGKMDHPVAWLIVLVALVATGSTFFHVFANRITMLMDVIPIMIFVYSYLAIALRRFLHCRICVIIGWLCLFTAVALLLSLVPKAYSFNGSIAYFPCLAALLIIAMLMKRRQHPMSSYIVKASLLFTLSLTCRSIDLAVCPTLPIGTHYFWHMINGVVLYLLTRAVMRLNKEQATTC